MLKRLPCCKIATSRLATGSLALIRVFFLLGLYPWVPEKNSTPSSWPRYTHPDHGDKAFVLKKLEDSGATFEHKPMFAALEAHVAELASLKKWKATKKECPLLCPTDLASARLAHNYDIVLQEGDKMQANALLMEAYMSNKQDATLLGFTAHPSNLVSLKKIKVKGLKLYPLGTCTVAQEKDHEKYVEKCKATVVWYKKIAYQVQPFKAMVNFQKPDSGTLCPFFWVKAIEADEMTEEINMSTTWVDYKGLQIPVLVNEEAVEQHTLLLKTSEVVPQLPPAKKARVS